MGASVGGRHLVDTPYVWGRGHGIVSRKRGNDGSTVKTGHRTDEEGRATNLPRQSLHVHVPVIAFSATRNSKTLQGVPSSVKELHIRPSLDATLSATFQPNYELRLIMTCSSSWSRRPQFLTFCFLASVSLSIIYTMHWTRRRSFFEDSDSPLLSP